MTAADARARIQERFGVEAVADGGLTVTLPRERWLLGVTAGAISTIAHWPAGEANAAQAAVAANDIRVATSYGRT